MVKISFGQTNIVDQLQVLWIHRYYFEFTTYSTSVWVPILVLVSLLEVDVAPFSAAAIPLTALPAVLGYFRHALIRVTIKHGYA